MIYVQPGATPSHWISRENKFNQDIQLVQETLTDGGTISFY